MIIGDWKINLLNYKCYIKLVVGVVEKYKIIKKIIIYFKKIIKNLINILRIKNEKNIKKLKIRN